MAQNNDRNNNDKRNAKQNAAVKGKQQQARAEASPSQRTPAHKEWSATTERNTAVNHRPVKETS